MFSLPPSRKEFRCRIKRSNGTPCDQWIYKDDKTGFVLNVQDGRGGPRGQRHKCPDRAGSEYDKARHKINMFEYNMHERHRCCPSCAEFYNPELMILCPICYKMECRNCHEKMSYMNGPGLVCYNCGGKCDIAKVFSSYERLYGKPDWKK